MHKPDDEPASAVRKFLQENIEPLHSIVRSYIVRTGLAQSGALESVTTEVVNEATLEALTHADRFRSVQQPRAWFLGIAANVIKRRRAGLARQSRHELPINTLVSTAENGRQLISG